MQWVSLICSSAFDLQHELVCHSNIFLIWPTFHLSCKSHSWQCKCNNITTIQFVTCYITLLLLKVLYYCRVPRLVFTKNKMLPILSSQGPKRLDFFPVMPTSLCANHVVALSKSANQMFPSPRPPSEQQPHVCNMYINISLNVSARLDAKSFMSGSPCILHLPHNGLEDVESFSLDQKVSTASYTSVAVWFLPCNCKLRWFKWDMMSHMVAISFLSHKTCDMSTLFCEQYNEMPSFLGWR